MKTFRVVLLFTLASVSLADVSKALTPGTQEPAFAGQSDAAIREILRVVARHQRDASSPVYGTGEILRRPALKDGDYSPVQTLAAAAAARVPTGIEWYYPWGVTLYGMMRSADATGDAEVFDWVLEHNRIVARYWAWLETVPRTPGGAEAWKAFERKSPLVQLLRVGNLDNTGAMGAALLEGMLRAPDKVIPEEKAVVQRVANWIIDQQARLPDGTFWRPEMTAQGRTWPMGTIWADDLYMSCPFLVRWAAYTGNDKHLTDAARQLITMAARLQDTDGVWFHAYSVPLKQQSPFKWSRANGWILVTAAEVLSALPENHPDRPAVLEIYRRHVAGVKKYQPESGVWTNIVDRTDIWPETSCTLMFAYAIARGVNRGWLPREDMLVARKAFAGVAANYLTPGGVLKGTVRGTGIGLTLDYYASRERYDDEQHGRGFVLLAGTEILNPGR
jgi:rhamnogalacturonyl hydrolase YesR